MSDKQDFGNLMAQDSDSEALTLLMFRINSLIQERDEVIEQRYRLEDQLDDAVVEATNAVNDIIRMKWQRDRLVEALNKIQLVMVDGFDKLKRIDEIATEALQSLTPKDK
jgi:hypothetical protein